MTWIRWDLVTPRSEVVTFLMRELGVSRALALGHYNACACGFGEQRPDGLIAEVADEDLELWALWRGKVGKFATALRTWCSQSAEPGKLRGWWRQEQLLRHQKRRRKRPPKSGDVPTESVVQPPGHGTVRNVTVRKTPKKRALRNETWLTPYGEAWIAALGGQPTYGALAEHLREPHELLGAEECLARWKRYLKGTKPEYCSPKHFASRTGAWKDPDMDAEGYLPVTNEFGACEPAKREGDEWVFKSGKRIPVPDFDRLSH